MIALQSGNFAISIQRRVEIYDFRKLHYTQKKEIFDNNKDKRRGPMQKAKSDPNKKMYETNNLYKYFRYKYEYCQACKFFKTIDFIAFYKTIVKICNNF